MANICSYTMAIRGKPESLKKAFEIVNSDYEYNDKKLIKCDADYHLFRTVVYQTKEDLSFEDGYIEFSGECAWSVNSCMTESGYYSRMCNYENFKGTTLARIAEEYRVDIEVYSEEPGLCFQEHLLIEKGLIFVDECVEWFENYNEETGEFESKGGFGTWDTWKFSI